MAEIKYNGAFDCANCPKSNDPTAERSCPSWWEWIETQGEGPAKLYRNNAGCGLQVGNEWMQKMMANNDFTTVNAVAIREEIMKQVAIMQGIAIAMDHKMNTLRELATTIDRGIDQLRVLHAEPARLPRWWQRILLLSGPAS